MSARPAPDPAIGDAVRDASWLAHRYDPTGDTIHFLNVARAEHRRAAFATDEHLAPGLPTFAAARGAAMAAAGQEAPLHFVFHSAFCCSTLVARAVDRTGLATALKEPMILNDIVGWRRRSPQAPHLADVLNDALRLLARPFASGEAVVVKPSTVVNGLAPAILTLRPEARALLLHAPLRTFLGSIAKKGIDGRLWIRTLLTGMLEDRLVDLGFEPRDYLGLTDLQVAAVCWLAQQRLFAGLVARFGPDRARTLDSAALLQDPGAAVSAIGALFGLPITDAVRDAILAGDAFTIHAKDRTRFDAASREAEHADAAHVHADEIAKVATWAGVLADQAGIAIDPVGTLIDPSRGAVSSPSDR